MFSENLKALESVLDHIEQIAASVTPEQQNKIRILRADEILRRHQLAVSSLRMNWNAPRRHVEFSPSFDGEWGRVAHGLNSRLRSGMLVGLVGTRGNGKTQMAVELMRATTENERTALFTTATSFFMEIKAGYKTDSLDSEKQTIIRYSKPALLVIDEIGKRGGSEWENNLLFEVINRRYNAIKDTLIIDNRTPLEFQVTIGPSISSRMHESGGLIECTWPSFRI